MADETCWTMIRDAAAGEAAAGEGFAHRYQPLLEAYLGARWRGTPRLLDQVGDATQEIFIECFRSGGALERANPVQPGGFRAFVYGVARNVARRFEAARLQRGSSAIEGGEPAADAAQLSRVFDREWARAIMREARCLHRERALQAGEEEKHHAEILRLRFEEGLPVRTVADRLGVEAAKVHQAYRTARVRFYRALRDVVAFHQPGALDAVEAECASLLDLLGGDS